MEERRDASCMGGEGGCAGVFLELGGGCYGGRLFFVVWGGGVGGNGGCPPFWCVVGGGGVGVVSEGDALRWLWRRGR